jgi:hypothetical protein
MTRATIRTRRGSSRKASLAKAPAAFRFGTSKAAPLRLLPGEWTTWPAGFTTICRFDLGGRATAIEGVSRYDGGNPGGQTNGGNVTRPRAADDFATIRGRMEELRQVTRPRAADDFAVIRARVEELRRERARVSADPKGHSRVGPRPYHRATAGKTEHQSDRLLPRTNQHTIRFP